MSTLLVVALLGTQLTPTFLPPVFSMVAWLFTTTQFPKSRKCFTYQTIVSDASSGIHNLTTFWQLAASIMSCEFTISSLVELRSWLSTQTECDLFNGTLSFLGFLFQPVMILSSSYGTSEIGRWYFALKSLPSQWLLSHLIHLALSPTSRVTSMRASFSGLWMAYQTSRLLNWNSYLIVPKLSASA